MCVGRYVGFNRCALADMWVSTDVRSDVPRRYARFSTDVLYCEAAVEQRITLQICWVFNRCAFRITLRFSIDVWQRHVGDLLRRVPLITTS